tara:strand:+ start:382 stop:1377 length:996 start_codon:yes stop_codon:yes gene_type:complete
LKNILVTGGNSYIGKHCIAQLLDKGYSVSTTVRSEEKANIVNSDLTEYLKHDTQIEYTIADLLYDDGWDEALKGIDAVFHVAGPYHLSPEGPDENHIKPHVEGTLRVLKAAKSNNVNRVILTSTAGTVWMGTPLVENLDETNWNDVSRKNLSPYMKGKTLGERAAWDFVEKNKDINFTSILPQLVFGPGIGDHRQCSTMKMFNMFAKKELPIAPKMKCGISDVRDVAKMHIAALENDDAIGRRFIVCSQPYWYKEMSEKLIELGYNGPTFEPPNFLVKFISIFDPAVKSIVDILGLDFKYNLEPAKTILGYNPTPIDDTFSDQGEYLKSLD